MPDLQPDLSMYPKPGAGGLGGMSLADLLRTASEARSLQRSRSLGDAIQQNLDPNSNTLQPGAAGAYIKGAGDTARPEDLIQLTAAVQAGVKARQDNAGYVANALFGVIGKKGATKDDLEPLIPLMRTVPAQDRAELLRKVVNPDGSINQQRLITLYNSQMSLAGIPTTEVTLPNGATVLRPAPTVNRQLIAGGSAGGEEGEGGAGGGSVTRDLPAGTAKSVDAAQNAKTNMASFQREVFAHEHALKEMETLQARGDTFGPGTQGRNTAEAFLMSLNPWIAKQVGVDPNKVSGYEMANKYLTQGMQQRAGQWGTGTDTQFASTVAGSPGVHVTDLSGIPLVKAGLSVRAMDHTQDWLALRAGDPKYLSEGSRLSGMMDPRAFAMKYASTADVDRMKKSLKGADREKFSANLAAGILSGAIPNNTGLSREQLQAVADKYFGGR